MDMKYYDKCLRINAEYILFSYYNKIKLVISLIQLYLMFIILFVGSMLSEYTGNIGYILHTILIMSFMYMLLFISRYVIESNYKKADKQMQQLNIELNLNDREE